VPQPNRAVDGRKLKKRRQGEILEEIVTRVQQTKEGLPVAADVMKTGSNTEYNEDIPYMVAWRAINGDVIRRKKSAVMSFQLIIPYLEELRRCNPSSLIGYSRDKDCNMFPSWSWSTSVACIKRRRAIPEGEAMKMKRRTLMIQTNRSQNKIKREETRKTFPYNTGQSTLSGRK
jgi:hypothetical protein